MVCALLTAPHLAASRRRPLAAQPRREAASGHRPPFSAAAAQIVARRKLKHATSAAGTRSCIPALCLRTGLRNGSAIRAQTDMAKESGPIPPPEHPTFDLVALIWRALEEDAGGVGDVTSLSTVHVVHFQSIPKETKAVATFLAKADGVLAGLVVAEKVFEQIDPRIKVEWSAADGDRVTKGQKFGVVTGPAQGILIAERVALNFMQRMGGIATATAAMVAETEGYPTKVLETRKTVPGLRLLDKWAVLIGGGQNHRMGLYDMIMIKDNHIAAAGGITAAVQRAQSYLKDREMSMGIEVETRTLEEVREVMELIDSQAAGGGEANPVTRVMLDNMTKMDPANDSGIDVSMMQEAVALVGGRVETEGSGNVTLSTIKRIASTGVTYVSVGALTHSVAALDISFNIETQ